MKDKIHAAVTKASAQKLCPSDINVSHDLAAIGVGGDQILDLVMALEDSIDDINGLMIEIPDDQWSQWSQVGDVYRFYGVE